MGALRVHYDNPLCSSVVELKRFKEHVDSGCQKHVATFSPSKLTVEQILSRPLQSPPTATEQKAAASVVKRMCATSPSEQSSSSKVVKLTTDGTFTRKFRTCANNRYQAVFPLPQIGLGTRLMHTYIVTSYMYIYMYITCI